MTTDQLPETTIGGKHFNRIKKHGDRTCVLAPWRDGRRQNEFIAYTWLEREVMVDRVAYGLLALGLQPGDRVAIIGENRLRWLDAFFATTIAGGIVVTVYPTMTAQETEVILGDSGARFAFASTREIADKVLSRFGDLPSLEHIIVMDPIKDTADPVMPFEALQALGDESPAPEEIRQRVLAQNADDLAVLIYTSGTTGEPKGVMLTHANFMSQTIVTKIFNMNKDDIWLSHIPLCHSFGMTGDLLGSGEAGGTIALAPSIDPEEMRWALTTVRPTIMLSVPRLYEKMYLKIQTTLSQKPAIAQKLFAWAHGIGREAFTYRGAGQSLPGPLKAKHRIADRILAKARKQAGFDHLRVAYAGGGPISPKLVLFFQGLGIDIYQGYGLTETSPVVAVNLPGNNKLGSVGPAIEGAEIVIGTDSEILIRGPMVMKGYWNKPEATAEAIDNDGWFHSGDIGHLDEDQYLFITDRKKEIIVTSGGKNIAPTRIENLFNMDPLVEKVIVIGNDRKFLSALIGPNFEELDRWARSRSLPVEPRAELVRRPEVLEIYQASINKVNAGLARFETIKKFIVVDHPFSEETGELTATQKVKRRVVDETYKEVIDKLYEE